MYVYCFIIILIIYFIVYILDHVDHEDLPRDGLWCTVYHSTTKKKLLKTIFISWFCCNQCVCTILKPTIRSPTILWSPHIVIIILVCSFSWFVSVYCLVNNLWQIIHSCLWFSCTLRTCLPSSQGLLNVVLQRSHLETMSGSNEYDTLEKYVIISLILKCNTVNIPYS